MKLPAALVAAAVACLSLATPPAVLARSLQQAGGQPLVPTYLDVEWHVSVAQKAPDCFQRDVVTVNDEFMPALTVTQGDFLRLNVFNDIPANFPMVGSGISIHFHGFNMRGYEWLDGVGHVTQCPITPGTNFTYAFQVNESAGTYMWHDHESVLRANGLQGALIVLPKDPASVPWDYDDEKIMLLNDWFHGEASALAMSLNRPFDLNRANNNTGAWRWVGLPQAGLINGKGNYQDCALLSLNSLAGQATNETTCNVTNFAVAAGKSPQQPWASPSNPGCSHESFTVEAGSITRFRIINNAGLLYYTVCFEGHNVTIIAADATPTEEMAVGPCLDVASGQRYDVLLEANQKEDNYWITILPQYRIGSPNGYAVLHYSNATAGVLPTRPNPQPGSVAPWSNAKIQKVVTHPNLVTSPENFVQSASTGSVASVMADPLLLPVNLTSLKVPEKTRTINLNTTQPLLEQTGQARWALNNVALAKTPPCTAAIQEVYDKPSWITDHYAPSGLTGFKDAFVQTGNGSDPTIFNTVQYVPTNPSVGLDIIPIQLGEVIELVLQNNPANFLNGEVTNGSVETKNRTGMETHPFHLHGHHFWVLGTGTGKYNSSLESTLNTNDAIFRDTYLLPNNGWAVIRFKADNPGLWFYHCHIVWHQFLGQALVFAEGVEKIGAPPTGMPQCEVPCTYAFGPFEPGYVEDKYGKSGYELPEDGTVQTYGVNNLKLPAAR